MAAVGAESTEVVGDRTTHFRGLCVQECDHAVVVGFGGDVGCQSDGIGEVSITPMIMSVITWL